MNDLPAWKIPVDLDERLARGEVWEDERYAPIGFSVEGDVLYEGRKVRSWQVEIHAGTPAAVSAAGGARDGYDLSERCLRHIAARDPDLVARVHDDSESATCVLWVETAADAEALVAFVWSFLFGAPRV